MVDLTTTLSNLVQHEKEFSATASQAMVEKSTYRAAGLITANPELSARAAGKSLVTSVPFWNPLAQTESKVPSDVKSQRGETGNIAQGELKARTNIRANGWSVMDLTSIVMGDDPMTAIANRVGEYWAIDEKRMVISILKGIKGAAGAQMTVGDGTTDLDTDLLIDAAETLGDNHENLGVLVVHKKVHSILQKKEKGFVPASQTNIGFDTYNGYKLVVDSGIAPVEGVYTSVLLAPGFFQYGEAAIDNAVSVARDEFAGNFGGETSLINRKKFLFAPAGMDFDPEPDAIAGIAPTNAELATAANWRLAFERENIPLAFIETSL